MIANPIRDLAAVSIAREKFRWVDELNERTDISGTDKSVAGVIASRFINRKSGLCWASEAAIAKAAGRSERSVRRSIRRLQDLGLIVVTRRGKTLTNLIQLALSAMEVTGQNERGDRPQLVGVTGQDCPVHIRTPERTPESEPLNPETPSSELSESPQPPANCSSGEGKILSNDNIATTDRLIPQECSDQRARLTIEREALEFFGIDLSNHKQFTIGERRPDEVIRSLIPENEMARLVALNRQGKLWKSHIAAAVERYVRGRVPWGGRSDAT